MDGKASERKYIPYLHSSILFVPPLSCDGEEHDADFEASALGTLD